MHAQLVSLSGRSRRGSAVEVDVAGVWPGPGNGQDVTWLDNGAEGVTPLIHQIWDDDVVETTCQVGYCPSLVLSRCVSWMGRADTQSARSTLLWLCPYPALA